MNLTFSLDSLTLQVPTVPFLDQPLENATDIVTLGGDMYTDFISQRRSWKLRWAVLDETQYNNLKAIYDAQFSTSTYPTFVLPYYSINTPVRMHINDKDIRKDGCQIRNVEIELIRSTGF